MSAMFERGGPGCDALYQGPGSSRERMKKNKYREQREIEVAPAPASEADS